MYITYKSFVTLITPETVHHSLCLYSLMHISMDIIVCVMHTDLCHVYDLWLCASINMQP